MYIATIMHGAKTDIWVIVFIRLMETINKLSMRNTVGFRLLINVYSLSSKIAHKNEVNFKRFFGTINWQLKQSVALT